MREIVKASNKEAFENMLAILQKYQVSPAIALEKRFFAAVENLPDAARDELLSIGVIIYEDIRFDPST